MTASPLAGHAEAALLTTEDSKTEDWYYLSLPSFSIGQYPNTALPKM